MPVWLNPEVSAATVATTAYWYQTQTTVATSTLTGIPYYWTNLAAVDTRAPSLYPSGLRWARAAQLDYHAERERDTAAARNREALGRRLAEEERERRGQAEQRARGLLLEHLTPEQRETFEDNGWFVVEGGESGTLYRIRNLGHMVANVEVLNDTGGASHRLCAHVPVGRVPMGDQLLAQKMMIEYSEPHFLRIANRHSG